MNTVPNHAIAALARTQQRVSRELWRWCSSRGALLVFLLVLAAALALSHILPQIPAHIRSDPSTYQEWLSPVRAQFRGWTSFLEAIGAFHVRGTAWFHLLLACLTLVLLVSGAEQVNRLLHVRTMEQPEGFYEQLEGSALSSMLPAEQTADCLEQALVDLGLRVHRHEIESRIYLHGSRRTWASLDSIAVYMGALLVILSLAIDSRWGWQQTDIHLLPSLPVLVGYQDSHQIELVDAHALPTTAYIDVGSGQRIPLEQDRATYHRRYDYVLTQKGGFLLQVTARGADDKTLALSEYTVRPENKTRLSFAFDPSTVRDEPDRLFIVPDKKLVVRIEWIGQELTSEAPRRFRQWVFEQGGQDLIGETQVEIADSTASSQIDGTIYTWTLTQYAVIDAAYQPGRPLFGIGAALVLVGLLGQMIPRHQVWGIVTPAEPLSIRLYVQSAGLDRRWQERRTRAWETLHTTLEKAS